jgi:hypothetical protein
MDNERLTELVYQALETETEGIVVYRTALKCAQDEALREEWHESLRQTEERERFLRRVCEAFGLDPAKETAGRRVVRHVGESLVMAMEAALAAGPSRSAEQVAAECVVLAETRDLLNWDLVDEAVIKLAAGRTRAFEWDRASSSPGWAMEATSAHQGH